MQPAARSAVPSHDSAPIAEPAVPILLYDGLCGFCDGTVQFILRHDRRGTMRFATLQGELGQQVLAREPSLHGVDSLVLIEGDRIRTRSDAALRIAGYLGGAWSLAQALRIVPRAVRDWGYDLFARHRYRLFGRHDSCPIPAPEVRARFIA